MTVNKKIFELRPINELFAIVKRDLKKFDEEGLIDEGTLVKAVMACNDRLGILVREIKQTCITINEFSGQIPSNFEKLYYICALKATNTSIHTLVDPYNNSFDSDMLYEVDIDRGTFGGNQNVSVVIKKGASVVHHHHHSWIPLSLHASAVDKCHISCPNLRKNGRYQVTIDGDKINTPFRCGEIYMMYLGTMEDEDGNILYPFHPLITPYYEWVLKEKILMDAIFNDDSSFAETQRKLDIAQRERAKAWIDAWNITLERGYGEWANAERKRELSYYNTYYKWLQ